MSADSKCSILTDPSVKIRVLCRRLSIAVFTFVAMLSMYQHSTAGAGTPGTRIGIVGTPLLFTRYYGIFNVERGGAGVFAATSDELFTGSIETTFFGDNAETNALVLIFKMGLYIDLALVAVDSSATIGPEIGMQYTIPFNPEGDVNERTTRIVLGVISHVPLGPGLLDVGVRMTPWGSLHGLSGEGSSSRYGLVVRYGFPL